MIPRLEQLEDRCCPSPVTVGQFAQGYAVMVVTLAQVEVALTSAAPPPLQPVLAVWIGSLNELVSQIPPAVLPFFGPDGVADSATLMAVIEGMEAAVFPGVFPAQQV